RRLSGVPLSQVLTFRGGWRGAVARAPFNRQTIFGRALRAERGESGRGQRTGDARAGASLSPELTRLTLGGHAVACVRGSADCLRLDGHRMATGEVGTRVDRLDRNLDGTGSAVVRLEVERIVAVVGVVRLDGRNNLAHVGLRGARVSAILEAEVGG